MKTKKEIQMRMMKIFADSDPKVVSLSSEETSRVHELEWVLGIREDANKNHSIEG
jgi:hypothetical protein